MLNTFEHSWRLNQLLAGHEKKKDPSKQTQDPSEQTQIVKDGDSLLEHAVQATDQQAAEISAQESFKSNREEEMQREFSEFRNDFIDWIASDAGEAFRQYISTYPTKNITSVWERLESVNSEITGNFSEFCRQYDIKNDVNKTAFQMLMQPVYQDISINMLYQQTNSVKDLLLDDIDIPTDDILNQVITENVHLISVLEASFPGSDKFAFNTQDYNGESTTITAHWDKSKVFDFIESFVQTNFRDIFSAVEIRERMQKILEEFRDLKVQLENSEIDPEFYSDRYDRLEVEYNLLDTQLKELDILFPDEGGSEVPESHTSLWRRFRGVPHLFGSLLPFGKEKDKDTNQALYIRKLVDEKKGKRILKKESEGREFFGELMDDFHEGKVTIQASIHKIEAENVPFDKLFKQPRYSESTDVFRIFPMSELAKNLGLNPKKATYLSDISDFYYIAGQPERVLIEISSKKELKNGTHTYLEMTADYTPAKLTEEIKEVGIVRWLVEQQGGLVLTEPVDDRTAELNQILGFSEISKKVSEMDKLIDTYVTSLKVNLQLYLYGDTSKLQVIKSDLLIFYNKFEKIFSQIFYGSLSEKELYAVAPQLVDSLKKIKSSVPFDSELKSLNIFSRNISRFADTEKNNFLSNNLNNIFDEAVEICDFMKTNLDEFRKKETERIFREQKKSRIFHSFVDLNNRFEYSVGDSWNFLSLNSAIDSMGGESTDTENMFKYMDGILESSQATPDDQSPLKTKLLEETMRVSIKKTLTILAGIDTQLASIVEYIADSCDLSNMSNYDIDEASLPSYVYGLFDNYFKYVKYVFDALNGKSSLDEKDIILLFFSANQDDFFNKLNEKIPVDNVPNIRLAQVIGEREMLQTIFDQLNDQNTAVYRDLNASISPIITKLKENSEGIVLVQQDFLAKIVAMFADLSDSLYQLKSDIDSKSRVNVGMWRIWDSNYTEKTFEFIEIALGGLVNAQIIDNQEISELFGGNETTSPTNVS